MRVPLRRGKGDSDYDGGEYSWKKGRRNTASSLKAQELPFAFGSMKKPTSAPKKKEGSKWTSTHKV